MSHKHQFDWFVSSRGKKQISCIICKKSLDDVIFKLQNTKEKESQS